MKKFLTAIFVFLSLFTLGLSLGVKAEVENINYLEITISNFTEITTSYTKTYTHKYSVCSDSSGTFSDIEVEAHGVYNNKNGIQMNKDKGTYIKNLGAIPGTIINMELTWTATSKNSPTIYMSKDSVATTSSTSFGKQDNSLLTQTINFDYKDGYNYFYFDGTTVTGACYLKSFKIKYAFQESKTYNVTYKYGNGIEDYITSNVSDGSKIYAAPEQTVNFKKAVGWYKDESLTQEWNFEVDTVSKDTTLYAKWIDLDVITLAEACTKSDETSVVIIGKINFSRNNGKNYYIQDSTGALILFDQNIYEVGSVYKIHGTITTYGGAKEITDVVAYEKLAQDIEIVPLTSPLDVKKENLSKYIELTNYEVTAEQTFSFYSGKFTTGDTDALVTGNIINVKGVVTINNSKLQITVSEVEALPSFVTSETKSSLIVSYDGELNPTNVDLRLGGTITADSYLSGATYGVLVTEGSKELTAGKTTYRTVEEFIAANEGFKNVTCTPARVNESGKEDENGQIYQFAWVLTDMEGHYNTEMTAVMYMIYDGALYICKAKTTSVLGTVAQYLDPTKDFEFTEEEKTVLNKIKA